ncbi:PREDICTED: protein ECT2 isoform X5 [Vollenhovia emeryi]|uniref:protein ECT2 isoform X5 n=1 Tax=Vollenhovia emeryi TaxID=411798 RepID=UPI0005F4B1C0|nr:PREDICTED: protein ECT2 isoform X5 [Vollenhovia emeryi]
MVVVRRRRRRWLRLCDFGKSRLPSLRRGSGRRSRVTFMLDTRVAVARRTSSRLSLARRLFKFIADGTDECRCTSGTGGHVRRGLRARGTEGLSPGKMEERSVHGSIGDINSAEASKTLIIPRKKRICLVGATCNDPALNAAAQQFKVPVLRSETGTEYVEDTTYNTYFVLKHFEGSEYDALCKSAHRVLGPTVLLQLAEKKESLPSIKRPMYTQAMVGIIVVFSGFRSREDELRKSANMILSMGGSIRKEMGIKVTHLIANHCSGEKYRYADTFGLPIMSLEWVKELWKAKDDISTYANNERLIATYRLKPFYGAKVCFSGFPDEEKKHMREVLEQQGGEPTEIDDPSCTHVVVDESSVNVRPSLVSVSAFIVKTGWFWTSVQNEAAADEKEYLFEHYLETVLSPTATGRRDSQQIVPQNVTLAKHPCWLDGPLSNLLQNGADSPASVSGSFLDCTASPDKQLLDEHLPIVQENLSQRHKVFLELVETEGNYVGILNTIMTLFKLPLENLIDKSGKELLNSTEVKIIFGNFPPIYETHNQLLKALHCSAAHWTEDISIGEIFLKFEPDLVKAYPPYVNFFENTKQMLEKCDQDKPRFHAFLKNCQTIPECSRQSLKELLIKPIQRLPSISLLLSDILKHTDKNNPDYSALEASISCIKKVMTYINEDKRKTERQLAMFDIFNEIDNCPPHLVSSHRSFISKCDVMEVTEGLSGRGDHLVLFLFTDTLEICKKRSKAFNSLKSPNTINGLQSMKLSHGKPYKHIKMLSLSTIRKVVDIRETDECHKVFALVVRGTQELKEKFFSFIITDEEVNKTNYLQTLCRQMALAVRVADADTLLIRYDSHQLEVGTSDVASGTLKKTIKSLFHNFYLEYMDPFASRTRARVGRAFSFNKTPSKLNRAMSTIMSPFGATQTLPPTNQQIAQMRLGSCNNISELDNGGSSSPNREDVLVAPMSDQPTRKALSMASLRRL